MHAYLNQQNRTGLATMAIKPIHILYLTLFTLLHLSLAHRESLTSYTNPPNDQNQQGCCSFDGNCGPCNGGNGKCCQFGFFCYTCPTKSSLLDFIKAQDMEPMPPRSMFHYQGKSQENNQQLGVVDD